MHVTEWISSRITDRVICLNFKWEMSSTAHNHYIVIRFIKSYSVVIDLLRTKSTCVLCVSNKISGPDSIHAESFKQGGYLCPRALFLFITNIWQLETKAREISPSAATAMAVHYGLLLPKSCYTVWKKSECGFRRNKNTVDLDFTRTQENLIQPETHTGPGVDS